MAKRNNISWIILTVLVLSCVLTISVGIWYQISYHTLLDRTEKKLTAIAHKTRKEIINFMLQQKHAIKKLSEERPIITAFSEPLDQKALSQFIQTHKQTIQYHRVILVKPDGTFIFSTTESDPIVGKKMSAQDYVTSYFSEAFLQSIMTDSTHISEFEIDSLFNEPVLFICTPVKNEGKTVGVLAVQINEEIIYHFIQSYQELGKTGETVLAKHIAGEESGALIIGPTRHAPFVAFKKSGIISETTSSLLRLATSGQFGSGIKVDYRGQNSVGAWCFIPMVDWGLATKQDISELRGSLHNLIILFYCLLLVTLCIFLWAFILHYRSLLLWIRQIPYIGFLFRLPLFIVIRGILAIIFIACFISFLVTIIHYNYQKNRIVTDMESLAQDSLDATTHTIEMEYLNIIKALTDSIAEDLTNDTLKKEYIGSRIKLALAEYWYEITSISIAYEPYAYDKSLQYYGRNFVRNPDNRQVSEHIIESYINKDWYQNIIKHGPQWSNPVFDSQTKQTTATYTVPFYWPNQEKVRGVISISFNLQFIFDTVNTITIGKTGYPFLIDGKGTFFLHPVTSYVKDKRTITDIAREKGDAKFQTIAQDMLSGKKSRYTVYEDITIGQKTWIIYKQLKPTSWIFAISFREQEVTMNPQIIRHMMMFLLVIALIAILAVMLFILSIIITDKTLLLYWSSIAVTIITALSLIMLWFIIMRTSLFIDSKGIIVNQATGLDKFIQEIIQEAQQKNKPVPIPLPVGLLIYSLNFPNPHHIAMTARIWQQYDPEKLSDNKPGIQIPNAQQTDIKEIFQENDQGHNVIGWKIETTLPQNYNYHLFPFDVLHTVIPLQQSDITKNLLLIPDLHSYPNLSPQSLPGIHESLSLSGFAIKQTYFSFEFEKPITTFGVTSYTDDSEQLLLAYNIIMTRDLLNPIVIYFLPLLVILISLFAIFWLTAQKDSEHIRRSIFGVLGAYTGLFFALILLHRNLRNDYPVGEVLYIEYLFFFTYLTILLFIINAVFSYAYTKSARIRFLVSHLISLLFWPTQLILWFITTIIIFY